MGEKWGGKVGEMLRETCSTAKKRNRHKIWRMTIVGTKSSVLDATPNLKPSSFVPQFELRGHDLKDYQIAMTCKINCKFIFYPCLK